MDTKMTKEEYIYILNAARDTLDGGEIKKPCPRCGKKLFIQFFDYGAYTIHCADEKCIYAEFRGL